ncbi:hypothetical protein HU200_043433 [Digitaria exilis]|uniref:Uncharacterized protein n=1 Tax=Digitaria exilis TaxID=1010633 RepID=A0A835B0E9_9POAL|nr:hypothetical protein HU200_043433 [Digitaria exilis]
MAQWERAIRETVGHDYGHVQSQKEAAALSKKCFPRLVLPAREACQLFLNNGCRRRAVPVRGAVLRVAYCDTIDVDLAVLEPVTRVGGHPAACDGVSSARVVLQRYMDRHISSYANEPSRGRARSSAVYIRAPMPVGLWSHARAPRDPRMHRATEADREPRSPGQLRVPAPATAANSAETDQFFQQIPGRFGTSLLPSSVGHPKACMHEVASSPRPRLFLPHRTITPACTTRAQQQHRPIHVATITEGVKILLSTACRILASQHEASPAYPRLLPPTEEGEQEEEDFSSLKQGRILALLSSSSRLSLLYCIDASGLAGASRLHSLPLSMMATTGCFQAGAADSSRTRRPFAWRPVLLLFLLLLLLLVPSCCQATRGMQPFKGKPLDPGTANHFLGFLPRGLVPPSGPSRQHNSIGAQDQSHPCVHAVIAPACVECIINGVQEVLLVEEEKGKGEQMKAAAAANDLAWPARETIQWMEAAHRSGPACTCMSCHSASVTLLTPRQEGSDRSKMHA